MVKWLLATYFSPGAPYNDLRCSRLTIVIKGYSHTTNQASTSILKKVEHDSSACKLLDVFTSDVN